MQLNEQFITVLRSALTQTAVPLDGFDLPALLMTAQRHTVSGLLYYAPTLAENKQLHSMLKRQCYVCATREATQQKELTELLNAFETEKIYVLPLKGAEIKKLYPKPSMRFMADTDLLIDPKQATQVKQCLLKLAYQVKNYNAGDTDFYISPTGMNLEIHRSLTQEGSNTAMRAFLHSLLDSAQTVQGYSYVRCLPHELHYAYVLCHFAKHLLDGGIGVRAVMDVWYCRKGWKLDADKLHTLLETLHLVTFAKNAEHLAGVWFGEETPDALSEELGAYILSGAVFGTDERRVADRVIAAKKSKRGYVLRRLFPTYRDMCFYFPVLKKYPILLPVFLPYRILRSLLSRNKKLSEEYSVLRDVNQDALQERAAFFRRCGLDWRNE